MQTLRQSRHLSEDAINSIESHVLLPLLSQVGSAASAWAVLDLLTQAAETALRHARSAVATTSQAVAKDAGQAVPLAGIATALALRCERLQRDAGALAVQSNRQLTGLLADLRSAGSSEQSAQRALPSLLAQCDATLVPRMRASSALWARASLKQTEALIQQVRQRCGNASAQQPAKQRSAGAVSIDALFGGAPGSSENKQQSASSTAIPAAQAAGAQASGAGQGFADVAQLLQPMQTRQGAKAAAETPTPDKGDTKSGPELLASLLAGTPKAHEPRVEAPPKQQSGPELLAQLMAGTSNKQPQHAQAASASQASLPAQQQSAGSAQLGSDPLDALLKPADAKRDAAAATSGQLYDSRVAPSQGYEQQMWAPQQAGLASAQSGSSPVAAHSQRLSHDSAVQSSNMPSAQVHGSSGLAARLATAPPRASPAPTSVPMSGVGSQSESSAALAQRLGQPSTSQRPMSSARPSGMSYNPMLPPHSIPGSSAAPAMPRSQALAQQALAAGATSQGLSNHAAQTESSRALSAAMYASPSYNLARQLGASQAMSRPYQQLPVSSQAPAPGMLQQQQNSAHAFLADVFGSQPLRAAQQQQPHDANAFLQSLYRGAQQQPGTSQAANAPQASAAPTAAAAHQHVDANPPRSSTEALMAALRGGSPQEGPQPSAQAATQAHPGLGQQEQTSHDAGAVLANLLASRPDPALQHPGSNVPQTSQPPIGSSATQMQAQMPSSHLGSDAREYLASMMVQGAPAGSSATQRTTAAASHASVPGSSLPPELLVLQQPMRRPSAAQSSVAQFGNAASSHEGGVPRVIASQGSETLPEGFKQLPSLRVPSAQGQARHASASAPTADYRAQTEGPPASASASDARHTDPALQLWEALKGA